MTIGTLFPPVPACAVMVIDTSGVSDTLALPSYWWKSNAT